MDGLTPAAGVPSPKPSALQPPDAERALLLDLDGVLLDTRPVMREAWRKVQEDHHLDIPFAAYEAHLGREFSDIMERLGVVDADGVHRTYGAASTAAAHLAQEFIGITDVLHAFVAAGWRLGVVTSKHVDRAGPLLAQLGCPFGTVRTPTGSGRSKPAPDPLLLALVELGVDPASAVYIGDMPVDREAATRAGVPYIHAAWGYGEPGSPAVAVAQSPTDLLALLHQATACTPFVEGSLV
ncbi:HAD-IA family hydrolase [Streptomyces sp. A3M-1-3]|uniref:HAD family hydrolase n=1 Tax=Streptomyces sp. A3M-1-3 TaxID=2962044 RepID=UPI0020B6EA78|nr:HAD-IA family hydrolase [Streptomyces sp. A3M-1-3]MCP3821827.1 HAD-IA family hydrolase [Streptomyces sp. A3M-1-3]